MPPPAPGLPGLAQGTLAAAAPGPNCWQLASAGREVNVDNDHVYRVPTTQLTTYLFRIAVFKTDLRRATKPRPGQSNPCGLLNSKLTYWSMDAAYIQTVLQVI
jgi:hypothetical protein